MVPEGEPVVIRAQARKTGVLRARSSGRNASWSRFVAVETERKFLVADDSWRSHVTEGRILRQGYLAIDGRTSVRVRTDGKSAWLTVKGAPEGVSRPEFEYPVPMEDAAALLGLCDGRLIEKTRHLVPVGDKVWEIDEFSGANEGLLVAELELDGPNEDFPRPKWLGPEVSDDPRYLNASLSIRPFRYWADEVG